MRYRFGVLITLIASVVFLFFFDNSLFAATLVQGETSNLAVLTNTTYLDGKPVLVFSQQAGEKISLLDKVDNVVLWDGNRHDLAVELAVLSVLEGSGSAITIGKEGIYELFSLKPQSADKGPRVTVDGKQLPRVRSYPGFKYSKLGQTRLRSGRRRITIESPPGSKVFLVSKGERKRAEKAIWRTINRENVGTAYILSHDQEIYVPHQRSYKLKMRVVSDLAGSENEIAKEAAAKAPVIEVDDSQLLLDIYLGAESLVDSDRFWWESKRLDLAKGEHEIRLLSTDEFKVDLAVLEPESERRNSASSQEPKVIFKRINPTKYLVKVTRAKRPFWLAFNESFHSQWRLYLTDGNEANAFSDIVANYPRLNVSEARHSQRFMPGDIRYLFRQADAKDHFLVNTYANGWYINPKKLGLGEDFILVLYFWPQSLFYLGLLISGLSLAGGLAYLGYDYLRRKK